MGTRKAQVAEAPAPLVRIAEVLTELRGGDPVGWLAEAERVAEGMRGQVTRDWRGHPCLSWIDAERWYLAQLRDRAQALAEIEERAIAAAEARLAAIPRGVPITAIPTGVSAAEALMLSDPFPSKRRQSVLEHSLEHPNGALVYTPINEDAP